MRKRGFLDRLEHIDESTREGEAEALRMINEGLDYYGKRLIDIVNEEPGVDLPLILAAMTTTADALKRRWPEAAAGTEEILGIGVVTILQEGGVKE